MGLTRYFAYGSNMCSKRLSSRVPSAAPVGKARLSGHRLAFHKSGKDGSGKADCLATGADCDIVWGVVYEIDEAEKPGLDAIEGLGHGYADKQVEVEAEGLGRISATTYVAMTAAVVNDLKPYQWYKRHLLRGAREHHLPDAYISDLEEVEAIDDVDTVRRQREDAIALLDDGG